MSEYSVVAIVFLELVAVGAGINLFLVWASGHGLRRLWTVGLLTAAVAILVSMAVASFPLYSYYCGPLCGEGWGLSPLSIALSCVGTCAALLSGAVRKRRAVKSVIGWLVSTVFLVPGLDHWVA